MACPTETARQLKIVMTLIGVLLLALTLRLAYIQIAGGEELSAAVRAQSLISLKGSNTRGIIYDRNGAPLVADSKRFVCIVRDEQVTPKVRELLDRMDAERVKGDNAGYHVYSLETYDKETGETLIREHHAYILQASARYSDEQTAAHLIGYVNEMDATGAAGLELMYDDRLNILNRQIYAVADVEGNLLPGRGLLITADNRSDSYADKGITTTIDKEIQQGVEEILEAETKDCAVVILDSDTGEVVSMACTPAFDPDRIESYTTGSGDELMNKATQGQYAPGSIFKIIVAAAALEQGVDAEQQYICTGAVQIGDLHISCETGGTEGHGEIGFSDAFAQSCNSFFIQLGQETGAQAITEMAHRFHLGESALPGFPQENTGHIMTEQEQQGAAIGNLSIGQGELLVTPLQVARMTGIIAEDGTDRGVHILMEEESDEERVVSEKIAQTIGAMMRQTTETGTAAGLTMTEQDGTPKASVKTGTAEYGEGEHLGSHGWMTGFTPCEDPEYVITVFVEEGASGAGAAGLFIRKF